MQVVQLRWTTCAEGLAEIDALEAQLAPDELSGPPYKSDRFDRFVAARPWRAHVRTCVVRPKADSDSAESGPPFRPTPDTWTETPTARERRLGPSMKARTRPS